MTRETTNRREPLRRALVFDTVASGIMGVLLVLTAGPLQHLLGLPAGLLRWSGVMLVPFAGLLSWIATREHMSRDAVATIIGGNVLWVVASILLLVSDWVTPTWLGEVFVLLQAAAVSVFAYLEYDGLRQERTRLASEHTAALRHRP